MYNIFWIWWLLSEDKLKVGASFMFEDTTAVTIVRVYKKDRICQRNKVLAKGFIRTDSFVLSMNIGKASINLDI